jgi:hypothetical protein
MNLCALRTFRVSRLACNQSAADVLRSVMMRQFRCMTLALLGLVLTGCTTQQKVRFHLAVANIDSDNPDLKFYRVTIKAKASNVKSDLQAGYYDANAVRQLYGTISTNVATPQDGSRIGTHQFVFDPATKQWSAIPDDQLFTIVYGVSAKAIAATIKAYNDSDQTGQQLASVIVAAAGRDSYMQAIGTEQLQRDERSKLSSLTSQIKDLADKAAKLPSTATPKDAGAVAVQAMQDTAQQLGSSIQLDSNDLAGSLQKAQQLLDVLQSTSTGK